MTPQDLKHLGIFQLTDLRELLATRGTEPFIVEDLFRTDSVNLLAGDSTLGKTPLALMLSICIASGRPFLGMHVTEGVVLYCDAESSMPDFYHTAETLCRHLQLPELPVAFHVWSPNWDESLNEREMDVETGDRLLNRVKALRPAWVVADAYRTFWPHMEGKAELTATLIRTMRSISRTTHSTWLVVHHRRKEDRQSPSIALDENPQQWMQEVAGSLALVNQTDTRLGCVAGSHNTDLTVAGFIRGLGPIATLSLGRTLDENGDPVGYHRMTGLDALNTKDRSVWLQLPDRFSVPAVKQLLGGTSISNVYRFLNLCVKAGLAQKTPERGVYARRLC